MSDVAEIARELTKAQREAWKVSRWEGEYYNPPSLPVWERKEMRRKGLLDNENCVTLLGERLISHLNPPSLWQRFTAAIRALGREG